MTTLDQPESTCSHSTELEIAMAAEAAEERITQALQREIEKVDKECMRLLQVRSLTLLD